MSEENLYRISNWLTNNASRIAEFSLNEPASDEQINKLKNSILKQLPDDFINFYKTYNGINDEENMGNFFYGMLLFSIDDIISDQEFRISQSKGNPLILLNHCDPEIDGTNIYNLNWVGFGSDGSRCSLRLDLSPSGKGTYGQIIFIDGTYNVGLLIANSMTDLINKFANDLETGMYSLNEEALEDEQHFLETAQEIDIENWHHIERWKKYV